MKKSNIDQHKPTTESETNVKSTSSTSFSDSSSNVSGRPTGILGEFLEAMGEDHYSLYDN